MTVLNLKRVILLILILAATVGCIVPLVQIYHLDPLFPCMLTTPLIVGGTWILVSLKE